MRENDEWCKRALVYVLRLTIAWVGVCATCLLSLWCASVERWDNRRQWRRSSEFVPMDRGRWRMNWMLEPRDRGPVDGPWIASTWRRRQASVHAKSRRCSPKSRQQLTKSRRLRKDLVIGWLRTSGDTHRDCVGGVADTRLQLGLVVSTSKPRAASSTRLGLKARRISGQHARTWHHRRPWIKVKLLHKGIVAVLCSKLNLDHFTPEVK
jgi:hypothetical protein